MCWGRISETANCFTFSCVFLYFINQVEFNLLCICVFFSFIPYQKISRSVLSCLLFPLCFLVTRPPQEWPWGSGTVPYDRWPIASNQPGSFSVYKTLIRQNKAGFHGCGHKHELKGLVQKGPIRTLPGDKVTIAATLSPHSGSGLPNTAQSVMWSCERRYRSTSSALEKTKINNCP